MTTPADHCGLWKTVD